MTLSDSDNSDPSARDVYAEFMRRLAIGELVDIAELCAQYPQLAAQLDEMHSRHETVRQSQPPETPAAGAAVHDATVGELGGGARRYGILERMAQGGMGVVYKVWDGILHRELAMKLIRERKDRKRKPSEGSAASPEALARFKREAEITARLDHPGVVPIHDMGTDDEGRVFFTMRLVKGQRLDQVFELARKQLDGWSQTRALDVIVKVCETLAFAHSRGVIHRDLKPANIMVGRFGETYVMDWGLAKTIGKAGPEDQATLSRAGDEVGGPDESSPDEFGIETRAGAILGTASYMAPEQAAGRIDELDERSDIYSAGAILYELLAGRRPYAVPGQSASRRDVLLAVVRGPPPSIQSLNSRVPAELAAICDKAMRRCREDRYQTMLAMAEELRAYLENRVVRAYQSGAVAELRKWVTRNRSTAIASALGLAIAFCGLLAVVRLQSRANAILSKANLDMQEANLRIQSETNLKDQALIEQTRALGVADAERRRAEGMFLARASADAIPTNPGLALLLALESDERHAGFAAKSALLAALPFHHEKLVLTGHRAPIQIADVSPDGARVATASYDQTAIIWDVGSGAPQGWLIGHRDLVHAVRFSHDGRLVATASYDQTAALWNARTGERLRVLSGHRNVVWNVAFSPDDRRLATAALDGTARIWDVDSGQELSLVDGHSAEVLQVAFSPDGALLLTGAADKTARLWDVASGAERARLTGHEGGVGVAIFSPDGRFVLTCAAAHWIDRDAEGKERNHPTADKTARIWDSRTGQLQVVLEHESAVESSAFSRDGRRVATGSTAGIVCIWDAMTGGIEHKFAVGEGAVNAVAFSPDGGLVAAGCGRGSARVWNTTTGWEVGHLAGHTDAVRTVAFLSLDTLLTASHDRTARIWSAHSAGSIAPPEVGEFRYNDVSVSPDGSRLMVRAGPSRSVGLYSFPEGQPVAVLEHDSPVLAARFSPDGELLGTLTDAGVVRIYAAANGSLDMTLDTTGRAQAFVFGADRHLVVISRSDGIVTTWKLGTRRMQHRLAFPQREVLLPSPDGRHLLAWSAGSNEAELWNLLTGTRTAQLPSIVNSARDFPVAQFSDNGETLVTWSLERAAPRLWTGDAGRLIAALDFDGTKGLAVDFSPEGTVVVAGAVDSAVRAWNTRDGQLLAVISKHEPSVSGVISGPNGERVVTSSQTKLSRLWNGRTGEAIALLGDRDDVVRDARFSRDGELLLTLNGSREKVLVWDSRRGVRLALATSVRSPFTDVELSPDGRWFASAFTDGSARIWPVRPAAFAKTLVRRQLTPDERDLYQVGTDAERAARRRDWNERSLTDLLILAGKSASETVEHARAVQSVAERVLSEFLEAPSHEVENRQIAAALARVEGAIRRKGEPAPAVAVVLAAVLVHYGDHPRAERLLKSVLDRQDMDDPTPWRMWAALSLGKAGRSPRQILVEFPKSRSKPAADLKWLLERLVAGEPIRIHAGGEDFTSTDGTVWRHDCFFAGGHVFGESFGNPGPSSEEILNTDDDPLYQTERWFDRNRPREERSYQIPLPAGRYRVVVHFAEIHFHPPESRVMNVLAEQKMAISRYDTLSPGFATADQRAFETRVDDGLLDLEFQGVRRNPKVSAIEIFRLAE